MANCRIYPTPNGGAHLGHLYLTLVNQYHAQSTGGKLAMLFDDTQPCWLEKPGARAMAVFAQTWINDMEWMGIEFDYISSQSAMRQQFEGWLRHIGYDDEPEHMAVEYVYPYFAYSVGFKSGEYPWEDWLTIEKVYMDYLADTTLIIRGADLHSEYSLYSHMWNRYITRQGGPKPPDHVYLPRMTAQGDMDTVSKTVGTYKIATYREQGWAPRTIIELLRESCLKEPDGEWSWQNVKEQPQLIASAQMNYISPVYGLA